MVIPLRCSSMSHVIDRATAFLFAGVPFTVAEVRPNSILLHRPAGNGFLREATYLVTAEPQEWPRRGEETITFVDEVNDTSVDLSVFWSTPEAKYPDGG